MEKLNNLLERITAFEEKGEPIINNVKVQLRQLECFLNQIDNSWSQSPLGDHASLYYKNFQSPPPIHSFDIDKGLLYTVPSGWKKYTKTSIVDVIKNETDFEHDKFQENVSNLNKLVENAKNLQDEILVELCLIEDDKNFKKENKILREIEDITWKLNKNDYYKKKLSNKVRTRDKKAISKGYKVPPHFKIFYRVKYYYKQIEDVNELSRLSKILIKRVNKKQKHVPQNHDKINSFEKLEKIFNKFHKIAKKLEKKYRKKGTFNIENEDDLQALLESLLIIDFSDVRTEEYVPSTAGGNAQIDFFLKNHKIGIESKITSNINKDRNIGKQLTDDIGKYKKHPDIRSLIFFIYDPEFNLDNRSGLKNDLMELSESNFNITIYIKPESK